MTDTAKAIYWYSAAILIDLIILVRLKVGFSLVHVFSLVPFFIGLSYSRLARRQRRLTVTGKIIAVGLTIAVPAIATTELLFLIQSRDKTAHIFSIAVLV